MFNFSSGCFLIFLSSDGISRELADLLAQRDIEYDLVTDYARLSSIVSDRCPDAIIVINNYPSSLRVVREIRAQRLFDTIPLIVLPGLARAVSFIQQLPPDSGSSC